MFFREYSTWLDKLQSEGLSGHVNEMERQFLINQGASPGQLNEMWYRYLVGEGYSGSLTNMLIQYEIDGFLTGAVAPVLSNVNFTVQAGNDLLSVETTNPNEGTYYWAVVDDEAAAPTPDADNGGWTTSILNEGSFAVGASGSTNEIAENQPSGDLRDLYLYQRVDGQNSNVIKVDNYSPENPFLTDTFDGYTGALTGYTGESGGTWTEVGDLNTDLSIASSELSNDSSDSNVSTAYARRNDTSGYTDCSVIMNVRMDNAVADSPNVRPVARLTDADNNYEVAYIIGATEWRLRSVVAGSTTTLASWSDTFANTETREVELRCIGTTISFRIDGVERGSVTNSAHASGYCGVRAYSGAEGGSPIDTGHVALDIQIQDLT